MRSRFLLFTVAQACESNLNLYFAGAGLSVVLRGPCMVPLRARFLARILACFLLCMFFLALVFGISSPISACSTYCHPTPLWTAFLLDLSVSYVPSKTRLLAVERAHLSGFASFRMQSFGCRRSFSTDLELTG